MFKRLVLGVISILTCLLSLGQGVNSKWLMGFDSGLGPPSGNILFNFDGGALAVSNPSFIMNFNATNAIICDSAGNILFSTNGIFIMNAANDTMQNGSGLNPGPFTTTWNNAIGALPIFQGNLILPLPNSDSLYILFHVTYNNSLSGWPRPTELLYSVIDMSLDNGLGGVIQKNQIILTDTIAPGMLTACKHANGRDWWIITREDDGSTIYKLLLTPTGITISTQQAVGMTGQLAGSACFSPDGSKYAVFDELTAFHIYEFDRCNGMLSNPQKISINDGAIMGGLSFSPDSKKIYASSLLHVYQYDDSATNIGATAILVATYDGYYSPQPPFASNFLMHQLAADGKIYINSANGTVDLHVINYPDSAGIACAVCQHCIPMGAFNNFSIPNLPNYYLGPLIGSICDSISIGVSEVTHDFKLNIFPNPTNGNFSVSYFLPENKGGQFEVYDLMGRKIYAKPLQPWSTFQKISLTDTPNGFFQCVIKSGKFVYSKKLVIME